MLPVSALSDAANKLRTLLFDQIDDLEDVTRIRIGHPKDTLEDMKSNDDKNQLNLFFYNVSYDGYPADGLSADPFYVRLHCLITAVGAKAATTGSPSQGENDLRLIGEVMRVLHQQPVISVDGGTNDEIAQLQVVPHPLSLDNLNHIWSTQGDTAYRLSVAYEMALAPIPLAEALERSPLVGEIGTRVQGDMDRAALPAGGFGIETSAPVVPKVTVDHRKPDWSAHICFVDEADSSLAYTLLVPKSQLPAPGPSIPLGALNRGIAAQDGATGIGYIMYSQQSVHTRWAASPPHQRNSDHLIAVKYISGQWHYDRNVSYVAFTPVASDLLMFEVDFSADTVTDLKGSSGLVNGLESGYADGDLVITPNIWGGSPNPGEFGTAGTWFSRNAGTPLQLKVLVAGKPSTQVELVWEYWNPSTGWTKAGSPQSETIAIDTIDPDNFDPGLAVDTDLHIQDKGQATLYAQRAWERPDGSTITLRSNPLLVTVYEGGA